MNRLTLVLLIIIASVADIFLYRVGYVPVQPSAGIIPLLVVVVFIQKKKVRYIFKWPKRSFLLFLFLTVLSIFYATFSTYENVGYFIGLILMSLLIYIVSFLYFRSTGEKTMRLVLIGALCLLGGSMLFDVFFKAGSVTRGAGFAENPNSAAIRIVFIIIVLLQLLQNKKSKLIALSIGFFLVFLTLSRSGLLMISLVAFFSFLTDFNSNYNIKNVRKKLPKTIITLFVMALIFSILVGVMIKFIPAFQSESVTSRIGKLTGEQALIDEGDTGQGGRVYILENYLKLFIEQPLGYGTGMSGNKEFFHAATHNMFLRVLIDFGILGFLVYFSFLFKGLKYALRNKATYMLCFFMVLFLASFFTNTLFENRTFIITLAILDALNTKKYKKT